MFIVLLCVGVFLVYTVLHWGRVFFFHRKYSNTRERLARDIIENAIIQRSVFHIEFLSKDIQGTKTTGVCTGTENNRLHIDLSGAFATKEWIDEKVLVLFQVSVNRKPSFYQFSGRILDIQSKSHTFILQISMPGELEPGQKRHALRITPKADTVLRFAMWVTRPENPRPSVLEELAPADITYTPEEAEAIQIDNLSAGGIRLRVPVDDESPLAIRNLEKYSLVTIHLVLKGINGGNAASLLLVGKVTAAQHNETTKELTLGVQFIQWAQVRTDDKPISWLPAAEDGGVAPLAAWILRHHLEQSKRL